MENYRLDFRSINKELLKSLDPADYEKCYAEKYHCIINVIKNYIRAAKTIKSNIRQNELDMQDLHRSTKDKRLMEETNQKTMATQFLHEEVSRIISEILDEFNKENTDEVSDEEIEQRKDELVSNMLKVDQLSAKFQSMLQLFPEEYPDKDNLVKDMADKYNQLKQKSIYEASLKLQMKKRELDKEKSFQASALNIKLQLFKGYASDLDIYTFQMEFEKLYSKATPEKMLPDLLKNNYLADPALSLVKSPDEIDEIWTRLKKAYGDANTMLTKKLASVRNIGPLWKLKDSERLIEGRVCITNAMTGLRVNYIMVKQLT